MQHVHVVHISLPRPDDDESVSKALASLLKQGIEPEQVRWLCGHEPQARQAGLFDDSTLAHTWHPANLPAPDHGALRWPPGFLALLRTVVMHAHADRYLLLHRFARRLHQHPALWRDSLDTERLALNLMARQVSREIHKMHAFVRFKPVHSTGQDTPVHVAWFEPEHHILRAAAPFFVRRFAAMQWAIFTPQGSAQWNRRELTFGPAADPSAVPARDAGDEAWQVYYRHIFNPARVKVNAMKREMPVRYWQHLPEAATIAQLLAQAPAQVEQMIEHQEEHRRSS